ncbi:hypothetical protein HOLleu_42465 [Holothuria leucospilota]|uniref:Uncharacterized protein n=1 Tax=Holothuria leucospilota TaxID=206669 RepID=A0A9Q0YBL6_HOLLE|nr:hypothetical protein HOLleu_42465 [Holothuria leucospilota]
MPLLAKLSRKTTHLPVRLRKGVYAKLLVERLKRNIIPTPKEYRNKTSHFVKESSTPTMPGSYQGKDTEKVVSFYERDEISRCMPGRRDATKNGTTEDAKSFLDGLSQ